ncbi:MAG TPA: hypothetical protein VJN64_05530 [Terriglobales bacterium]|nr:hypothetical protein [Terriglobales bacterium]
MKALRQIPRLPLAAALAAVMLGSLAHAKQKSLEQLKVDAEKAHSGHRAELYSELALRTVDVANQQFTQGKSVEAQKTVQDILDYATKAHDAALEKHKKMKDTEIHLRETQRELENLRRTLAADDRPPVEAVEKTISDFRQDLLNAMFGSPRKEKK